MQQFQHSTRLPASAAEVIRAITTREYLLYRYEDPSLHHLHIEISRHNEEGFTCTVARSGSTEKLPGFARRVVGDRLTMIQDQSWEGWEAPISGHLHIHLEGLPGHVHVDLELADADRNESVLRAEGQVVARIPLVGARIEKMLIGRAEQAFAQSAEAIRSYVAAQQD